MSNPTTVISVRGEGRDDRIDDVKKALRARLKGEDWPGLCAEELALAVTRDGKVTDRPRAEALYELCAETGHLDCYDRAWANRVGDPNGPCLDCENAGTVDCPNCDGEGEYECCECGTRLDCDECSGRGTVACSTCKGT